MCIHIYVIYIYIHTHTHVCIISPASKVARLVIRQPSPGLLPEMILKGWFSIPLVNMSLGSSKHISGSPCHAVVKTVTSH